jgi:hypothetical protein
MTIVTKVLAVLTFFLTIIPIAAFGKFENEFLRMNIILSSLIFTFFANEHYLVRLAVSSKKVIFIGPSHEHLRNNRT